MRRQTDENDVIFDANLDGAVGQVAVVPIINEDDRLLEILCSLHKNLGDVCLKHSFPSNPTLLWQSESP